MVEGDVEGVAVRVIEGVAAGVVEGVLGFTGAFLLASALIFCSTAFLHFAIKSGNRIESHSDWLVKRPDVISLFTQALYSIDVSLPIVEDLQRLVAAIAELFGMRTETKMKRGRRSRYFFFIMFIIITINRKKC